MSSLTSRCTVGPHEPGFGTPQDGGEPPCGRRLAAAASCSSWSGWAVRARRADASVGLAGPGRRFLLRSGSVGLFGPVLFYDLMCIALRGRSVLLLRLCPRLAAVVDVPVRLLEFQSAAQCTTLVGDITRFAELFYLIFMAAESLVVLLLTPAYVAGSGRRERPWHTRPHVATDLSNREIVLSKLVARAANLAILVVTGLPILSLTQFFGGIDPNLVLSGFAALGLTLASLACLSILHSTYARKPRDAIVFTYLSACRLSRALVRAGSLGYCQSGPMARGVTGEEEAGGLADRGRRAGCFHSRQLVHGAAEAHRQRRNGQPLAAILPGILGRYALFHAIAALCCTAWAVARVRVVAMKQAGLAAPAVPAEAGRLVRWSGNPRGLDRRRLL